MARTGDVLSSPNGDRLIFLRTAEDTGGQLVEVEVTYVPVGEEPPDHYHPARSERSSRGRESFLQLAVILSRYDREFRLAKPPFVVQKVVLTVLAGVGRLLGYRAEARKREE